jgi:hypothetical protein
MSKFSNQKFKQHGGCLIRGRNCLAFMSTWVHHWFLMGSVLLIFFSCLCCVVFLYVFVLSLACPMLPFL